MNIFAALILSSALWAAQTQTQVAAQSQTHVAAQTQPPDPPKHFHPGRELLAGMVNDTEGRLNDYFLYDPAAHTLKPVK